MFIAIQQKVQFSPLVFSIHTCKVVCGHRFAEICSLPWVNYGPKAGTAWTGTAEPASVSEQQQCVSLGSADVLSFETHLCSIVCCSWRLLERNWEVKMIAAAEWHSAKTALTSARVFTAHQAHHGSPPKASMKFYCAQLPFQGEGGIISPCNTVSRTTGLRRWKICILLLLLSAFTVTFWVPSFLLEWPPETSTTSRPGYSDIISCVLFLYSQWQFLLIALPHTTSGIITAVDWMPQEVISVNWQLCLCKSSANLWNLCGSSFRLTASSYLSTHIRAPFQGVFHLNLEKHCNFLALLLPIKMKAGSVFYMIAILAGKTLCLVLW